MPEWLKDAAMLGGIVWFGSLLFIFIKHVADRVIGAMK